MFCADVMDSRRPCFRFGQVEGWLAGLDPRCPEDGEASEAGNAQAASTAVAVMALREALYLETFDAPACAVDASNQEAYGQRARGLDSGCIGSSAEAVSARAEDPDAVERYLESAAHFPLRQFLDVGRPISLDNEVRL